mgnify:CR=1 FL=1
MKELLKAFSELMDGCYGKKRKRKSKKDAKPLKST